jgi:hypothetical protein
MAEYEALLCGLKIAIKISIKRLDVREGLATRDRPGHEKRELPRQ